MKINQKERKNHNWEGGGGKKESPKNIFFLKYKSGVKKPLSIRAMNVNEMGGRWGG